VRSREERDVGSQWRYVDGCGQVRWDGGQGEMIRAVGKFTDRSEVEGVVDHLAGDFTLLDDKITARTGSGQESG
jgi:hypothetical protein